MPGLSRHLKQLENELLALGDETMPVEGLARACRIQKPSPAGGWATSSFGFDSGPEGSEISYDVFC